MILEKVQNCCIERKKTGVEDIPLQIYVFIKKKERMQQDMAAVYMTNTNHESINHLAKS